MSRILHVDDEPTMVARVRELLEPHFEWVGSIEDGDAVLAAAARLRPDVVLLDISLAGRNGFDVARELRLAAPHIKLVFLTVHRDEAYVEEAFRIGATGYVLKSAIASELVPAIRAVSRGGVFVSARLPKFPP